MPDMVDGEMGEAVTPPNPWDPLIRISHWCIAAGVVANEFILKPGGIFHVWAGWLVMILLGIRLIWGFVGPREARFKSFPPAPRAAMKHLQGILRGKAHEYPSHNPAGAMMVYAIWLCLSVIIATGLIMTDGKNPITIAEDRAAVAAGDWSVLVKKNGKADDGQGKTSSKLVEEVHEVAANLLLFLAIIHVFGVAAESRALGRNLVRSMLSSKEHRP